MIELKLEKFCKKMEFVLQNMPMYLYIKDTQSNYIDVSQSIEKDWGVKRKALIRHSDYETPWDRFAEHYQNCDDTAMQYGSCDVFEPLPLGSNNHVVARSRKFSIKDDSGEILGVIGQTELLSFHSNLNDALLALMKLDKKNFDLNGEDNPSYRLSDYPSSLLLSARESQCLFLLARGKTAKEIALFLNLSHRTVETYIENVKRKLGASSRSEVIEKAMQHGILDIIPKREMLFHLYNHPNKLKSLFE